MNTIQITIQSALHTSAAIARKGKRDLEITWEFLADEEMIKLYQAIWQTIYGFSMFCYGVGVLSAKAIDKFIQDSIVTEEVVTEEIITEEVVTEEIITEEVVTEEIITEEVVTEEVVTEEVVTEEVVTEEVVTEEVIFEETIKDVISSTVVELDNFFQSLSVEKMRIHLREIGQPYRVNNRRFNRSECVQQYQNYLANLSE
jgi:hypothetical protein